MRSYRVVDLPVAAPLIVPSVIPTRHGIGDLFPATTKPRTRFQRSKQRLVREEPSEKREDELTRANFSPCGRPVTGLARIEAVVA
jgi:hypothetical protein